MLKQYAGALRGTSHSQPKGKPLRCFSYFLYIASFALLIGISIIVFVLKNDKKKGVEKVENREKNKYVMCKKWVCDAHGGVKKRFFSFKILK